MQASVIPNEWKVSYLRIYSYAGGVPAGTLENACYPQPLRFDSLMSLLRQTEALLDHIQFPRRVLEPRHFGDAALPLEPQLDASRTQEKPLASFRLQILFRQNASWQGDLVWLETRQTLRFRSALELCLLLDEALQGR